MSCVMCHMCLPYPVSYAMCRLFTGEYTVIYDICRVFTPVLVVSAKNYSFRVLLFMGKIEDLREIKNIAGA